MDFSSHGEQWRRPASEGAKADGGSDDATVMLLITLSLHIDGIQSESLELEKSRIMLL